MLQTATTGNLIDTREATFDARLAEASERLISDHVRRPAESTPEKLPELDTLRPELDSELTLGISLSVPLAAGGATLLAYGATLDNQTCSIVGGLCIASLVVVQFRLRRRVKNAILAAAKQQGCSELAGKLRTKEYLKAWLG